MLGIMLCGASDTEDLARSFAEVTQGLGGEAWHYRTGEILYLNSATASWERNSRRTVSAADLCVFVILRRHGEITWTTELKTALDDGKPFLLLCLDTTYAEYLALTRSVPVDAIIDENKRKLVETITELESERHLTVATFNFNSFKDVYRREAAKLFEVALQALGDRTRRQALIGMLSNPAILTKQDLAAAEELALDEFEDKRSRKLAISALVARGGASVDTVLGLIKSREQGIQRFAISELAALYVERPADLGFLDDCVSVANESDDTGVTRRLIPAIFEIGIAEAIHAFDALDLGEIGARRRLASILEVNEKAICEQGLESSAISLLGRCLKKTEDGGWLARGRCLMERLESRV